jgi:VWFA-related protein
MSRLFPALLAVCLCGPLAATSRQAQKPPQERPPVFRAGAHYVNVDAYPSRDGHIVEGLTADDFEILEDGKPQAIDAVQFIRFDAFTSDEERRDPNSQRDAFALAADPSYRVFVLYLDAYHVDLTGSHSLRQPLVNMLQRILGPRDLFGMLTPRQMPRDLILGRQTQMIEEQLGGDTNWIWGLQGRLELEPEENALMSCFGDSLGGAVIARRRLDKVFSDLEGLVALLGSLRDERKNILVFSRGWVLGGPDEQLRNAGGSTGYKGPPIGITDAGKITLGTPSLGGPNMRWCMDELQREASIDFRLRHRDLLRAARQANVAFYPVNPTGLEAPVTAQGMDYLKERTDRLIEMAINTDGVAVVNTNDLTPGLTKISNDLSAYYVLGYYTTNTKWDGNVRKITVRLKGSKDTVRARREYRAPTEAEMASLRTASSPAPVEKSTGPTAESALGELARLRPAATLLAHGSASDGELTIAAEITAAAIEVGRWKSGGEVEVIASGANKENAGSAKGRIEAGARGTLLRVPVSGAGPWTVSVRLRATGEEDQFDRITVPVPSGLLGEPLAYRATPAPASPLRPVGAFQFRRTERIHVDWPILQTLDRRDVRLLGRDGQPLALQLTLGEREEPGRTLLGVDLNLAPLTAGDYVIEVTAGAGAATDRKLLAIRIVR